MTGKILEPEVLAFLEHRHAGAFGHTGGSLMEHLLGTWRLLVEWRQPQAVNLAGLFHSVYGTEAYREACISTGEREAVRSVIGAHAEGLAYAFCIMQRRSFYEAAESTRDDAVELMDRRDGSTFSVSGEDYSALAHILVANWLEQRDRVPDEIQQAIDAKVKPLLAYVSNAVAAPFT